MKIRSYPHRALGPLLAVACLASAAHAQTGDRDEADRLFREGRALLRAKHVSEACALFEESLSQDTALGTLLNLAYCHELEGKTATAMAEYQRALAQARAVSDHQRARFVEDRLSKVEAKRSTIQIEHDAVRGEVRVEIDGKRSTAGEAGAAVALDPGRHTVKVTAPGRRPWSQTFDLAPGPTALTVFVPTDALPRLEKARGAHPSSNPPSANAMERSPSTRWMAWSAGAIGVVGLGAGSYFGLRALSKTNDAEPHCTGSYCDDVGLRLHDEAKTSATWSTVGFAVGAVGVGVALYSLLDPLSVSPRKGETADVRVNASWNEASLRVVF
jgi:hypothetical protein